MRAIAVVLGLGLVACQPAAGGDAELDEDERALLARLGPLPPVPPSPTNALADDPRAAALGHRLFFDPRLSADGRVSCSSCHRGDTGLSDPEPLSKGSFGRVGTRHASTLVNAAYNRFQLWDGRADSLWAQPIKAIENEREGDVTRCELVRIVAEHYREDYEALFGPLPPLHSIPARAKPGDAAWEALPPDVRDAIDRVVANVGKAIEAHVRRLVSRGSALDAFIEGDEDALDDAQRRGARIFVRDELGRCIACHDGPNLTDDTFHVLGLHQAEGPLDPGRLSGAQALLDDRFNGVGPFSDDVEAGQAALRGVTPLPRHEGAFKTTTLRDVTLHPPYGHLGSVPTLREWMELHEQGFEVPGGSRFAGEREGTIRPFSLDEGDVDDLLAFLEALEGEPLPAELLRAPP